VTQRPYFLCVFAATLLAGSTVYAHVMATTVQTDQAEESVPLKQAANRARFAENGGGTGTGGKKAQGLKRDPEAERAKKQHMDKEPKKKRKGDPGTGTGGKERPRD
jgi:hypothetical protein